MMLQKKLLLLFFFLITAACATITSPTINHPGLFSDTSILWPTTGRVSSDFGYRFFKKHKGIDIANAPGTEIVSVARGEVLFAGHQRGYGNTVIIKHHGYQTLYAHCQKIMVKKGMFVRQGQRIGLMGSTGNAAGPHLYFEIRGEDGSILNPLAMLPAKNVKSRKI